MASYTVLRPPSPVLSVFFFIYIFLGDYFVHGYVVFLRYHFVNKDFLKAESYLAPFEKRKESVVVSGAVAQTG